MTFSRQEKKFQKKWIYPPSNQPNKAMSRFVGGEKGFLLCTLPCHKKDSVGETQVECPDITHRRLLRDRSDSAHNTSFLTFLIENSTSPHTKQSKAKQAR